MLHRVTNTVYDPTATCPTFERFLETIFKGNQRVIAFLQRFLGYCLTGLTTEQAWVLFIGPGSNGKSTLSEATAYSLGDYALTAPSSLFLERQGETIPNDIAKLPGRRLVYAKEPDKNKRLATGRIKELTGGDTISARFMRGEFFEFKPVAKLILSANHFPPVRDQSHGFWRRIFVLLFEVQIDEQDKELPEKLRAEAAGILNWLIAGCLEWQQQGLNPPQEVLGATKNYRTESDLLGEWINECCELDKGVETAFTPLYESWKAFLEEYGEIEDRSRRAFANRLVERGLQRRKTMNGPMYKGIRIQPNFKLTGHN
jgi:putative DNA primase/helicase